MTQLHIEQLGAGPDLVLLHGWGLHGGIWEGVKHDLAQHFALHIVDLPGYGLSDAIKTGHGQEVTVHEIAKALQGKLPKNAIWLGWSFGGCIATAAACLADFSVRQLITVASNPKFTASDDWPCAMKAEVLQSFGKQIEKDYASTIKRFLAIQSFGAKDQKSQIKTLQKWLLNRPEPDNATLKRDLQLLQTVDLRDALSEVIVPHLAIFGKSDALVPKSLMNQLQTQRPQTQCEMFANSSHAPFVSEPGRFVEVLKEFTQKDLG